MTVTPGDIADHFTVLFRDPHTTAHIVPRAAYWNVDRDGGALVSLCGHREQVEPGLDDQAWSTHFAHPSEQWEHAPVCHSCVRSVVVQYARMLQHERAEPRCRR